MKMMFRFLVSLFALALTWPYTSLNAQNMHRFMLKGQEAYDGRKYNEAEKYFNQADEIGANPEGTYNRGNAQAQLGKWEEAAQRFAHASQTLSEPMAKADALHNLGNALLHLDKPDGAVKAYENSLRLRPGDPETKRNLQTAKKRIIQKKQEEQQKQNQQQQQQQNQQNQQQPSDNNQQQQNQQQNQQQQQTPSNGQPEQQKQQQQRKASEEEARRLLETSINPEDQKNARKYRAAQQRPAKNNTKKDW